MTTSGNAKTPGRGDPSQGVFYFRKEVSLSDEEREVVRIFLHDLYHNRDIKRKMREVTEQFRKEDLLAIVFDLKRKGILDEEEGQYLQRRINELYKQ